MAAVAYAPPGPNLFTAPSKTITFTGLTGAGLAGENVTVYTITGRVAIVSFPAPFCTTSLTEASSTATVSLGTTTTVAAFLAATNSTVIDANEWWDSATDGNIIAGSGSDLVASGIVPISNNIVIACAAQNTNGGVLVFNGLQYIPLTAGAGLA